METPRLKYLRTYDAPPPFTLANGFRGTVTYDSDGIPIVYQGIDLDRMQKMNVQNQYLMNILVKARSERFFLDASIKAAEVQQQLSADVQWIETFNAQAATINERILPVLQQTAEAPESATDADGLNKWWYDKLGYSYEPPEQATAAVNIFPQVTPPSLTTCFAAGTHVRTMEGSRAIEEIHTGDLVLSQDVETGQLDFRPIVMVHHNKPNRTLRVTLSNDDVLVASIYHRFWLAGKGWSQTRDLKQGDVLRTIGGTVRVVSVEPGNVEPLYNLDVSRDRSFFVGESGVLVHDNTLPPARHTLFDQPPTFETSVAGKD
jgi:hypothetical protein